MGGLFMIIKYLGAIYLLWLGFALLTTESRSTITVNKKIEKRNLVTSFLAGFFLTLGDVKAIVFYVSLFPVFINLSALQMTDVLVIVSVMVVSVGGVKVTYAFSASKVSSFARSHKFDNAARKTAGGFMVGAGSYLIIKA